MESAVESARADARKYAEGLPVEELSVNYQVHVRGLLNSQLRAERV